MGEVDEALAVLQGPLLDVERAVVRGDRGVDAVAGDRAGQVEQRAVMRSCSPAQVPKTVRWPMSAMKPWSASQPVEQR